MSQFRCQIVTPSDSVLDEEVAYVSFPAWEGQVGVMPGTSPFLMTVGAGRLRIDFASGSREYLLDGGFAQMEADVLVLLADGVTVASELELEAEEQALAAANATALEAGHTTDRERKRVEHEQARARAAIALALSAKSRPGSV